MPALRVIAAVAVLGLVACGGSSEPTSGERRVVASFYPLAYATERVGGGDVLVTNLTPPGAEPHDIELTPRDIERILEADLVLYLDAGFQPAVEDAVAGASGETIDLLDGIELLEPAEEDEHQADPHVWLDPKLYARIVGRIGDELDADARETRLVRRLEQLDAEFEHGLAHCERKDLVTSHSAFGYLAARYGLEQVAISGVSPEAEPTPRELENAVRRVRETGATTIFFETLVPADVARTVARETGAATAVLNPIEGLTQEEIDRGEDYFSIMHANLGALRKALGCR